MITLSLPDAAALVIALALTCAAVTVLTMRAERRRYRAAIHAVERGIARDELADALRREYTTEITDLRGKNRRLAGELREVRVELADAIRDRDAARRVIRRVDALTLDLTRRGQFLSARRVAGAVQDVHATEAVLPDLDGTAEAVR